MYQIFQLSSSGGDQWPKHLGSFFVKIGVSAPIIHAAFTSWKKWCQAAESHNLTSAHPTSRLISYERNTPTNNASSPLMISPKIYPVKRGDSKRILPKSARTVGAKGRVFPEALTQSALAGGGGSLFLQVKCMVRS